MVSVSLWAVPIGARSFQKKYKAKEIPHVTLMKDVNMNHASMRKAHTLYPNMMTLKAQTREMVVRKVDDHYEYGWIMYNDMFMLCHMTEKGESPPSHLSLLDSNQINAIVTYSIDGILVDPSDLDTVWAYDSDEVWF
jgi:hypothetical protein